MITISNTQETAAALEHMNAANRSAGPGAVPPIIDAFNHCLRYGFRFALSTMRVFLPLEPLRRAQQNYRMRIIRCPGEGYQTVAAYDSVEWRTTVKSGSVLWGINSPFLAAPSQGVQGVQVFVGASQTPMMHRVIPFLARFGIASVPYYVAPLTSPVVIAGDGSIIVKIANSAQSNNVTVLLFVAEPR